MRHSRTIMVAIFCLVPSFISAQSKEVPTTKGSVDGYYWLKLDEGGKVQFINGVKYGIKFFWKNVAAIAAKDSGAPKSMKTLNPKDTVTFATEALIKQVDTVYRDTTNIHIALMFVYQYAVAKLSGESSGKLERMLDTWKKEQ